MVQSVHYYCIVINQKAASERHPLTHKSIALHIIHAPDSPEKMCTCAQKTRLTSQLYQPVSPSTIPQTLPFHRKAAQRHLDHSSVFPAAATTSASASVSLVNCTKCTLKVQRSLNPEGCVIKRIRARSANARALAKGSSTHDSDDGAASRRRGECHAREPCTQARHETRNMKRERTGVACARRKSAQPQFPGSHNTRRSVGEHMFAPFRSHFSSLHSLAHREHVSSLARARGTFSSGLWGGEGWQEMVG